MITTPLQYHIETVKHLKLTSKTWEHFAGVKTRQQQLDNFKTELLKNTYKFDVETHADIYNRIAVIKERLQLNIQEVNVYQAQHSSELNASILYSNNEAHIVLSGNILQLLKEDELTALLAHELGHIKLYQLQNGEIEVADRLITSIANSYDADAALYETARLFKLYTEIFCDRCAYLVCNNIAPPIATLVKISTGLDTVNPESYVKQAAEIFKQDKHAKTEGITHPENYIRARAISLWHQMQDEATPLITAMIEGTSSIDNLDVFKQKHFFELTRTILQLYLKPRWFRSALVNNLAKQYYQDFNYDEQLLLQENFANTIHDLHDSLKEYLAYVLLDFALVDTGLEEIPVAWALKFSESIGLAEQFSNALKKELKLTDKKFSKYVQGVMDTYGKVKENELEQIYEN